MDTKGRLLKCLDKGQRELFDLSLAVILKSANKQHTKVFTHITTISKMHRMVKTRDPTKLRGVKDFRETISISKMEK